MVEGTQRRLAAIVSADVVGYSRLMGVDETGTLAALRAHRNELIDPLISEHGGRIVKTMGDGLLLEFPSVVDATQCLIKIQEGMVERNVNIDEGLRITFRVGVNLGDIIIDGDDIHGDGVNIAARLQEISEPGGISISRRVHEDVRDRLDTPFEDAGEQTLKNIARPVHVWRWSPTIQQITSNSTSDTESLSLPDKPSIAVLPFDNMSGEPEQEYFADGMTEEVITELSRFENLFVIARNTSFTYKNKAVDVKSVALELGVHFILEGSVRKAGNRVRITVQLINGQNGGHVWAERYDGKLEDIFDLQDEVTRQVVGNISSQITISELKRAEQGEIFFDAAHDLAWQARSTSFMAFQLRDPSLLDRAVAMAIEAVEMNNKCAVGYQTICAGYVLKSLLRWGDNLEKATDLAEDWARRFLQHLPHSSKAHYMLGRARARKGLYREAMRDFEHAHELNPNDPNTLQSWAVNEARAGLPDKAKKHAHMSIRLSPKDNMVGNAYLALAIAAFIEDDADQLENWAEKAIQAMPTAPIRRALMIAYAAKIENSPLLERHRAELMEFAPNFIESLFQGKNQLFQKPEHMEMLLDGLRKAGFSE